MYRLFLLAVLLICVQATHAQTTTLAAPLQLPASSIPAGATDANVFNFTLTRDNASIAIPVIFNGLTLTSTGTASASDYTQLKLYSIEIGGAGITQTLIASAASPGASFSGFNRLLLPDVQMIYLVTAAVPAGAQNGATFVFSLTSAQVSLTTGAKTGGPIQGNTHTIDASGMVPTIQVRDAAGTPLPGGLGNPYDLQAAQGDTGLGGQTYTFSIHNNGSGPLTLSGVPAVLAAPAANCSVTVGQPASTSINVGASTTFTLTITPTAAGAYSLGLTIFNNSVTNPYLLAIEGVGSAISATQLAITTQPGGAKAGSALSPQPVVEARDAGGALDASFNGLVTASVGSGPAGAKVVGVTTAKCVNGVAVFSGLAVDTAGTGITLQFSSGALTPAVSDPFDVSAGGKSGDSDGGGGGDDEGCVVSHASHGLTALLAAFAAWVALRQAVRRQRG